MLEVRQNTEKYIVKVNRTINRLKVYKLLLLTAGLIVLEKVIFNVSFEGLSTAYKTTLDCFLTLLIVIPPLLILLRGNTKYSSEQEKAMHMALHDSLTELPNRTFMNEQLKKIIIANKTKKTNAAVMFLDLDGFKAVNDTLGHDTGDKLLQAVAKRLENCIRQDDFVCRLGGDEFVMVFPNTGQLKTVEGIANKVLEVFKTPFSIENNMLNITTSIGISLSPENGKEVEVLIKNADMAMYKSKLYGKNRYEFYSEGLSSQSIEIASDAAKAISN